MSTTKIEWAEAVWNPVVGCTRVSEGCRNCYAERMAKRLQAMGTRGYDGVVDKHGRWTGKINVVESAMTVPLRRKKPTVYFVNSMSDMFHQDVSNEVVDTVFAVMGLTPQHRYIVLTKRAALMRLWTSTRINRRIMRFDNAVVDPLPNVWVGFSAENQTQFDLRWRDARHVAALGWQVVCSAEPLLGPIDMAYTCFNGADSFGSIPLSGVIVGGESGPGARPMDLDWVRKIRDDCDRAGVPFFLKQICENGHKVSRLLDGREHNDLAWRRTPPE